MNESAASPPRQPERLTLPEFRARVDAEYVFRLRMLEARVGTLEARPDPHTFWQRLQWLLTGR